MSVDVIVWAQGPDKIKGWNGERDHSTLRRLTRHDTVELEEALEATYDTDAHFVPYLVVDPDGDVEAHPFRINKRPRGEYPSGIVALRDDGADVRFDLMVLDVDAPKSIRNREGARRVHAVARWYKAQIRALAAASPELGRSAWSYSTRGGCRFLWILAESLEAEAYEDANRSLRAHLEKITKDEIKPDHKCADWTRCYRLPNVQRDGRTSHSAIRVGKGTVDVSTVPLAELTPKRKRIEGLGRTSTPLDSVQIVRSGGRNSWLCRVAGAYRRAGMEIEELEPALQSRNERICDPPLDADEVEAIAMSVCGYPVGDDGDEGDLDPERERGLDSGSEAEVAEFILVDSLEGLRGEPLAFDQGALWRYDGSSGMWEELRKSEITGLVFPYDGANYGSGKNSKTLRVSAGFCSGVYKLVCELRDAPGYFDAEAPGVAFRNGLVRIGEDGELEIADHNPDARKRFVLGFDYSDRATCPRWLKFLDEVFESDDDKDDKIALLGEFVGACLLGQATKYQRALLLVGEGANGKSTFLNTIAALFPPRGRASVPPQDLGDPYQRATLAGIAINVVTEMPERDLLASEALKAMVDGSIVRARHPYGRPFDFRASAGMLFAANDLPGIRDTSHGFWRRWLAIRFARIFVESEQERGLEAALLAELAGIAVWALDGVSRLLRNDRYTVPASSIETRDEWRHDADSVAAFVEDRLEVGAQFLTKATPLYLAYRRFCEERGLKPVGAPKFGRRLLRRNVKRHRASEGRSYLARVKPRSIQPLDSKGKVSQVSEHVGTRKRGKA